MWLLPLRRSVSKYTLPPSCTSTPIPLVLCGSSWDCWQDVNPPMLRETAHQVTSTSLLEKGIWDITTLVTQSHLVCLSRGAYLIKLLNFYFASELHILGPQYCIQLALPSNLGSTISHKLPVLALWPSGYLCCLSLWLSFSLWNQPPFCTHDFQLENEPN